MNEAFIIALRAVMFGTCISSTAISTIRCGKLSDIGPRNIPLQPPDWIFGVVWPCLYITTGIAWLLGGNKADIPLGMVTLLNCLWLVVYGCLKRKALAAVTLVCTAITTILTAIYIGGTPGWLLVPLAGWTAFASYLNIYDAAIHYAT